MERSATARPAHQPLQDSHHVERSVRRQLLANPRLQFSSLVIRRIRDGICLQGVLEADEDGPDVCSLAQQVAGVEKVINRLVVRRTPGRC